jgi:hypothetical protein
VDPQTRRGSLATLYVNRVFDLAAACGVDGGTLLGRAMAHELAHLLLGSPRHSSTWLMGPHWPADMVRQARTSV